MGAHIGAQKHANCPDQGFKCFAMQLTMRSTYNCSSWV